jgi:hypothetical protein
MKKSRPAMLMSLAKSVIVSLRQKTDDSHWGETGSSAIAALTANFKNSQDDGWFNHGIFTFKLKS